MESEYNSFKQWQKSQADNSASVPITTDTTPQTPVEEFLTSLDLPSSVRDGCVKALRSNLIATHQDWLLCGQLIPVGGAGGIPAKIKVELDKWAAEPRSMPVHSDIMFAATNGAASVASGAQSKKLAGQIPLLRNRTQTTVSHAAEEAHSATHLDATDNTAIITQFKKWKEEGAYHKVIVKLCMYTISDFETSEATCMVDFGVQLFWMDPAFENARPGEVSFQHGQFRPELEFKGGRRLKRVIKKHQGGHYWLHSAFAPHGIVQWYQRYHGHIHQELELSEFPFDEQDIRIKFNAAMLSSQQLEFVNWTDEESIRGWETPLQHTLHEWVLEKSVQVEVGTQYSQEDKRHYSFCEVVFPVQRNVGYYFFNIFLVVFFISAVNWWAFLLAPELLDQKLIIIISCFLTLVALNLVVADKLPRINKHTVMTVYFLIAYCIYALSAMESGISYLIFNHFPREVAVREGLVNTTTTLLDDPNYRIAKILDWASMGVIACVQTIILLIVGLYSRFHWNKRLKAPHLHHTLPKK